MLKFGAEPFLECSGRGDKRFSAMYARVQAYGNKTIEELYQGTKIFDDGSTGLSIKAAKGRKPVNVRIVREFYSDLWDLYIAENPELKKVIGEASGFSDIFGQKDHACQAEEIWRIKNRLIQEESWGFEEDWTPSDGSWSWD